MPILHGTWIPKAGNSFIQTGQFYLWVETTQNQKFRDAQQGHPRQLTKSDLVTLLTQELGIKPPEFYSLEDLIEPLDHITLEFQPISRPKCSRNCADGI